MFRKLFHILATASVLVGCSTAAIEEAKTVGYLAVGFSCGENELTKAGDESVADYPVEIRSIASDESSQPYELISTCGELPAVLELEPGGYTITVSSPNAAPAAFDTPIYSSSKDFTIRTGVTVSMTLLLQNVAVTVLASEAFLADAEECTVTVGNEYGMLTWSLTDVTSKRTGYFTPSSFLTIHAEGKTKAGVPFEYSDTIWDVKPSEHHNITMGKL